MKISTRNLLSWVCTCVLLGVQVLPSYTWADNVNSVDTASASAMGMIGKVTYLLGQADVTQADGSRLPLAVQMGIPDGSRIQVKDHSIVRLLMVDGGIEKLGSNTVFKFDKYAYDPNNPQATEIRKTLFNGEVTSTTGKGGKDAKEHYRLNSPLAAIAVLGTEYTVKVGKGETWVTVHSGEISIAKLGGSCQRSGLGACAGGVSLSQGQQGLAMVVRASEPKPILMPISAVPVSEKTPEALPEKASEKSEQVAASDNAVSDKPADAATPTKAESSTEPQKSVEASAASPAPANQQASTATMPTPAPASSTPTPAASSSSTVSPAPVTEKALVAKVVDERNALDALSTVSTAKATSTVESTVSAAPAISSSNAIVPSAKEIAPPVTIALNTPVSVQLPNVAMESAQSTELVTSNNITFEIRPVATVAVEAIPENSRVKLVSSVPEKANVAPLVAVVTPAVDAEPEKPNVATPVVAVPPAVEVEPKLKVVTPVVAVLPAVEAEPETPKAVTPVAVVAPTVEAEPVATPVVAVPSVAKAGLEPVVTPVVAVLPIVEAEPPTPKAVTPVAVVTPAIEVEAEKVATPVVAVPSVAKAELEPIVTPVVAEPEKPKAVTPVAVVIPTVEAEPEKPKTVTPVAVVTPTVDVELENPKTVTAVSTPTSPALVAETVKVVAVTAPKVQGKPAIALESAPPTINWGKYDPAASIDGTTSLGEQVNSNYTQLIQQSTTSPVSLELQQNPTATLPEQRDVGFALGSYTARINNAGTGTANAATVDNAHLSVSATRQTYDTGFTLQSPDYTGRVTSTGVFSGDGGLRDDGSIPQTQLNGAVGAGNNAAAYTFTHQIDAQLSAGGVLNWTSP